MAKTRTGRAIVHFPYRSRTTNRTYNSVILSLERASNKYSLPGGQFDASKDSDTLDTALRELKEELNLDGNKSSAMKAYTFDGHICSHDIYLIEATGVLKVDKSELLGIGFYNAGRHNQIPRDRLERHARELSSAYFGTQIERVPHTNFAIPAFYIAGNTDSRLRDWLSQKSSF